MSNIFLILVGVLLCAHAYVALRVGLSLTGKAFLFVFAIVLASTIGLVADTLPSPTLSRTIIYYIVVVCIQDLIRTWFVASQVRKGISVIVSSLAFAVAISFFEIVTQLWNFLAFALYRMFNIAVEHDVEFFEHFFSSSSSLAMIALDVLRPLDHYFLCLALYYSWRMGRWLVYSALIMSHIVLDVIIDLMLHVDPLNSDFPILAASLPFSLLFLLAAFWTRAIARRRSADEAAEKEDAEKPPLLNG